MFFGGKLAPHQQHPGNRRGCARSAMAASVRALESAGHSWCNRIVRVRMASRVRVLRTSNGYDFPPIVGLISSRSETRSGTRNQYLSLTEKREPTPSELAIVRMAGLRKGTSRNATFEQSFRPQRDRLAHCLILNT